MKNLLNEVILKDKETFAKITLYGILSIVTLYIIAKLSSFTFGVLAGKVNPAAQADIATLTQEQGITMMSSAKGYLFLTFVLAAIFIILMVYDFVFFENLIWNTIFKRKTTFKNTNVFLALAALSSILLGIVLFIIFAFISRLPGQSIKVGAAVFAVIFIYAIYLLFISYVSYGRTQKIIRSIKNMPAVGIKNWKPFVVSLIVFVMVNVVLLILRLFPSPVYLTIVGIAFSAYLAWFRIYLTNSLKAVKF